MIFAFLHQFENTSEVFSFMQRELSFSILKVIRITAIYMYYIIVKRKNDGYRTEAKRGNSTKENLIIFLYNEMINYQY